MVANEDATYGDLFQWGRIADGHEKRNKIAIGSFGDLATDNTAVWTATTPPIYENGNILGTGSQTYPQQQVSRTDPNGYYGKFIKTNINGNYNWYAGNNVDINIIDMLWRENAFAPNDPCQHIKNDGNTYSTFYPDASTSTAGGSSGTGWRMPSQSEWASIFRGGTTGAAASTSLANTWSWFQVSNSTTEGAKGFEIKPDGVTTTLLLPASGNRNRTGAILYYQGAVGYYWSGSVISTNAIFLYFNTGGTINPASIDSRGNGFAVRCIKN